MPTLRPDRLLLPLFLLAAACSTRVVELTGPDAARFEPMPGAPECETFKRSDGFLCQVCFGADGSVIKGACAPATPVPPPPTPSGTGVAPAAPAPQCKPVTSNDTRCLGCTSSTSHYYMPCLKCEQAVITSAQGDRCRTCLWDDAPTTRCLQCFTAQGTATSDDCDTLRREEIR